MLVDDLNELAFKNKLFDHTIDQKLHKQLDQLYNQRDEIYDEFEAMYYH